jgi:hypothetical protein
MKRMLMLVTAFVMMLFLIGNGMLDIIPTASAQEVSTLGNMQDTAAVESSENMPLTAPIIADTMLRNCGVDGVDTTAQTHRLVDFYAIYRPSIDSTSMENGNLATMGVDSLGRADDSVAEDADSTASKQQYKNTVVKWGGRNRYGKFTDQCAAHVNGCLSKVGYYTQGHAYQIPSYFPSIINGYMKIDVPSLSELRTELRFSAVLNMHRQAADYVKEHLDISKLVPGKYYVVNMYYNSSPYMLQFFYAASKQGTVNYGTHVGVLYYNTEYEVWIVEHNIHGHVHYDALESILGGLSNPHKYVVTSISRVTK